MANLQLTSRWNPDIYQIALDDPVEGGPNGVNNRAPREIAENALFLKTQMDEAVGGDVASTPFNLRALTGHADQVDNVGRNLFDVLGVSTIQAAMAALSARCNGTGTPNFTGLMIGDFIDGINLSAIPEENGGDAGQVWNATNRNNQIVISGFNTYRGIGDTENNRNHILFTFRNIPLRKRMNATNINAGGYIASEMRAFLEGLNGNGTGDMDGVTTAAFMNALVAQLGAGRLYTIRKHHSTKGNSTWASYTVFLPSELEVLGYPNTGDEGMFLPALTSPELPARAQWNTNVQFPIFSRSGVYRGKRYNGGRYTWWLQTPTCGLGVSFRCDLP